MEVRAIKAGFYGTRRRPNAVFDLTDKKHFSANWMAPTKVEAEAQPAKSEAKAEARGKGFADPKSMV